MVSGMRRILLEGGGSDTLTSCCHCQQKEWPDFRPVRSGGRQMDPQTAWLTGPPPAWRLTSIRSAGYSCRQSNLCWGGGQALGLIRPNWPKAVVKDFLSETGLLSPVTTHALIGQWSGFSIRQPSRICPGPILSFQF